MIKLGDYYRFSADDISAVALSDSTSPTHPFSLTVYLKSGKNFSINYSDARARKASMIDFEHQFDRERKQGFETMLNKLFLIEDAVCRVDKRQLRIWKQLKALLGVKVEDEV